MYTAIGIAGSLLILLGFYRTSVGKWTGKSFWYELDNFVGALLVMVYQFHYKAYVTMVVNIIWAVVALRGLSSYAERRRNAQKNSSN
ncbi:hypothetical protein H0X09_01510 [Candidatus Saccharibacteria bacterium]|nr:hypothetical protein [Candidatus Saccharibacteria bacterium]